MNTNPIRSGAFALLAAGVCVLPTRAAEKLMTDFATAASLCQAATSAHEGRLRTRPTGVLNEGRGDAFVTCAWQTEDPPVRLHVYANAFDGADVAIDCTLVSGEGTFVQRMSTRSIVLPGHGAPQEITWVPQDLGQPAGVTEFPSAFLGMSCRLPPGAKLGSTYLVYRREIGA